MAKNVELEPYALDMKTAASYACVSLPTLSEWLNRDDFPAFRSGRKWVIPKKLFEKWMDDQASKHSVLGG